MKKILLINIAIVMSLSLFSCSQAGTAASAGVGGTTASVGSPIPTLTISGDQSISTTVIKGNTIQFLLTDGNLVLTSISLSADTILANIVVTDENGNVIPGTCTIVNGYLVFTPIDVNLIQGNYYTITITSNYVQYVITVLVPIVLFPDIALNSVSVTLPVATNPIVGWKFGSTYQIYVKNIEAGCTVLVTMFATYDISDYKNQIYFQRWYIGDGLLGDKMENYLWYINNGTTSTITVDNRDYSIPNPAGGFYSFATTYNKITINDASGTDVTATSGAEVVITTVQ